MSPRAVHDLIPYLRLGSLLVLAGVLVAGMFSSFSELLPSWRSRLSTAVVALLAVAALAYMILPFH